MDVTLAKSDVSAANPRAKPAVPKKPANLTVDSELGRNTHVRDMIRRLQGKEQCIDRPSFLRKPPRSPAGSEKEEMGAQASSQTLEDLKAIDEDIEKLRKQIEERDKIISALREAAEAKDKKLDNLMLEYSKLQSNGKLETDSSSETNRATSSSPSTPPLCNGELCWTDNFVSQNYHEPVYAKLLNEHTALQKVYNELRAKLGSDNSIQLAETECRKKEGSENAITFIMAEQIRALKEREAQLIWEAEELREQNDLMEFRILELEECRKEFLDKEVMNEGKHRGEKIVWRERDIEEVSDSGVMSLPTSEDLTSDSELGEAIRNYSPLGPLANPGLSTPENPHSDSGIADLKPKKSLKSSECLQESGIFVDSESSVSESAIATGSHSQACQTESVLDKTLLDIIDSSCDLFLSKNPGYLEDSKSDDLTTEISKLSVIQRRIQQKTNPPPAPKSPHTVPSCPHSNSLLFYEERLAQLEDKLKIYESSGDTKELLLAKRLQKEVELAHRVKELSDKVTSLEASRRKLEEEKCEFEEAENDARFQCQRLEIRLEELIEKNTELELELERQKVIMNEERRREKKKGSLEGLLNKYEQRNFELEEKELETRLRLNMIEAAMPAILAFNMFKMVQNPDLGSIAQLSNSENPVSEKSSTVTDPVVFQRLEEVLNDQKKLRKDYRRVEESAADREKELRMKIEELEAKSAKDRELLEEMTNTLKSFKATEKDTQDVANPKMDDLFEELKLMVGNEIQLRAQIEHLEKKEQAYMQSLEKADEIWAGMEADYQRRLKEAEEANMELQKRVSQLEAIREAREKEVQGQESQAKPGNEELINLQELLAENEKLKMEISRSLDAKFEEHKRFLEMENTSLKEELKKMEMDSVRENKNYYELKEELSATREELEREKEVGERLRRDLEEKTQSVTSIEMNMQGQISELTQELNQKSKELSSLEATVLELREEVETLENKVAELVETIQTSIKNQDEGSSTTDASQWSHPTEEDVSYVAVDQHNPFKGIVLHQVIRPQEIPAAREIILKREKDPLVYEVVIPRGSVVMAALHHPREEARFVFSPSNVGRGILLTGKCKLVVGDAPPRTGDSQTETDAREEEIFQLSLKNTELQQTLERMEEESKWKDRELEELQNIAMEIRREQESLQELYRAMEARESQEGAMRVRSCEGDLPMGPPREPRRTPSLDILHMINPLIVKASEQICTKLSSLQIAFDNLQSKYRSKYAVVKPLVEQTRQKGDDGDVDEMAEQLALEYSSETEMREKREEEEEKERRERPGGPEEHEAETKNESPSPAPSVTPIHPLHRTLPLDPTLDYSAPITIVRRVAEDGIFLEWDVSQQPPTVTGFEVRVNGELRQRVRSSSRNRALVRPVRLKEAVWIEVLAVSAGGRAAKSSEVRYPEEYFLLSPE